MTSGQPCGPGAPTPGSPADLLEDADPASVAHAICLRQLTMGPRTRSQLADVLARRGVPEEAAAIVLDRFTEVGLINDASFARQWVESRHHGRGLSRRALAQEMRRKGVADEEMADALSTIDGDAEREMAVVIVTRRLPATRRLHPDTRVRRLVGMLTRKGYSPGLAVAVVREALAAEDGGEPNG
ncbi:MAG: regulatory protein RecX [Candidatus Nanopelagicales bacterium]